MNSSDTPNKPLSYRDAGVDISAGDDLVERIKPFAKKTFREGVLTDIGGFGALFEISKKYSEPVLVSGTDGVGTKLRLAFELDQHDTVGIDLVAMSVNDVLVQGAEPLFFLDYYACGKLDVDVAAQVIQGIAFGCKQAGCALIGGETAEMPGMYPEGEYDLAGFAVGVVEKNKIIDGSDIREGDAIIGLASSGPHSNGYSLIRRIIARAEIDLESNLNGKPIGQVLLEPTRIYVKPVLKLLSTFQVKGIAHITGGGLLENIPRIVPERLTAVLDKSAWEMPAIFTWLKRHGDIAESEMYRTFNCGIGMVLVIDPKDAQAALDLLTAEGEQASVIGTIAQRQPNQAQTVVA